MSRSRTPIEAGRAERAPVDTDTITRMVHAVRPFTMVPEPSLVELGQQVAAVLAEGVPGDLVECGVWRGGAAFLMAGLLRAAGVTDRKVWLCDSFEGLPAPEPVDGPAAGRYAGNPESPRYFDNCRASLDEVRRGAGTLGVADRLEYVEGWFDRTLPSARERIGPIALLRIDGDWHSSVKACLDNLYDAVVDGGLVVLDDYYAWDGCAVALHEFLGARSLPHRIESLAVDGDAWDGYQAVVLRKAPTTWRLMRRVLEARREIAGAVPAGSPRAIVDDQRLGLGGLPFPERDGERSDPPDDDAGALAELARLREAGVRFLAFAWPSFWWLDHYGALKRELEATARRVLATDRVIVYDLGPR